MDKIIEELSGEFYCSYDGICMGSEDKCYSCVYYRLDYEDFKKVVESKGHKAKVIL